MPTRNTGILAEIIEALGESAPPDALQRLEDHFKDLLIIVAGTAQSVPSQAKELRLAITTPECAQVLDYIGNHALAGITLDQMDEVINTLFPDRFQEP